MDSITMSLAVVCFKWRAHPQYRSKFTGEHVNVLRNMVARHLHVPHTFTCITDDPEGIDPDIRIIPLWDGPQVPHMSPDRPNCYRRLRLFAADAGVLLRADRILSLDLDTVICGDITPLVTESVDFAIWGDTAIGTPYNGSMWMLKCGARTKVWDEFDPLKSPAIGKRLRYIGSDQAWIAACLGKDERKWTARDGVYSFRNELMKRPEKDLPDNAKVLFFHGKIDPWHPSADAYPWIAQHWR